MTTRIIGLGNSVLTDDGVGIYAARELARRLIDSRPAIEVIETETAGFGLMELLSGCARAILIDAIQFDDLEPGTVVRIDPQDLRTSLRLRSVHEIDLPTVLALGRSLSLRMPEEIAIYAIQSQDSLTLSESLTAPVAQGLHRTLAMILEELDQMAGLAQAAY
jgi:hydrogenase maturation protease